VEPVGRLPGRQRIRCPLRASALLHLCMWAVGAVTVGVLAVSIGCLATQDARFVSPIEKAENALNNRIARLQTNLRATKSEAAQGFLFQSLIVCTGIGEALTAYIKMIGQYAQGRHQELKQAQDTLTTQHADWLKTGNELLERLKANPSDKALRKEIEQAQQAMAGIQKTLRRGANSLQRDVSPSLAMIDPLADSIRRLAESDDLLALQRVIKLLVGHVNELYRAQPNLPAKDIIDPEAWETSAMAAIESATDFHEAWARAGNQGVLALDLMTMAVSPNPPESATEAIQRANESAAERLKAIALRLVEGGAEGPSSREAEGPSS
jgi:hypothetical protein